MRELKRTCLSDVCFQICIAKCFNSYGDSTAKPLPKNAKNSTSGWGAFVKKVSLCLYAPYGYGLRKTYTWLPITRTLANSNLALTRTKIDFPWISVIHSLKMLRLVVRTLSVQTFIFFVLCCWRQRQLQRYNIRKFKFLCHFIVTFNKWKWYSHNKAN